MARTYGRVASHDDDDVADLTVSTLGGFSFALRVPRSLPCRCVKQMLMEKDAALRLHAMRLLCGPCELEDSKPVGATVPASSNHAHWTLIMRSAACEAYLDVGTAPLRRAAEEVRMDHECVLMRMKSDGQDLRSACADLKKDRAIVLAAVQQCGLALEFANEVLQDDAGICFAAISRDATAMRFASARVRSLPEARMFRCSLHVIDGCSGCCKCGVIMANVFVFFYVLNPAVATIKERAHSSNDPFSCRSYGSSYDDKYVVWCLGLYELGFFVAMVATFLGTVLAAYLAPRSLRSLRLRWWGRVARQALKMEVAQ